MSVQRRLRRRLSAACGLLALGALGATLSAAVGELPFWQPSGDLDSTASPTRFTSMSSMQLQAFGPPAPFGARRFANDPTADGRAR